MHAILVGPMRVETQAVHPAKASATQSCDSVCAAAGQGCRMHGAAAGRESTHAGAVLHSAGWTWQQLLHTKSTPTQLPSDLLTPAQARLPIPSHPLPAPPNTSPELLPAAAAAAAVTPPPSRKRRKTDAMLSRQLKLGWLLRS
jgi:hypothetical protein